MQRIFIKDSNLPANLLITGPDYHHLAEVLHLTLGKKIEAVDAKGQVGVYQLFEVATNPKVIKAKLWQKQTKTSELPLAVTLLCALTKGQKIDETVEKGTEFGANHFIFFPSQYSPMKFSLSWAEKKKIRLNKIAASAAKQAHRTVIPQVEILASLPLASLGDQPKFLAYEKQKSSQTALKDLLAKLVPNSAIYCAFGPEGGFAPAEVKEYVNSGFQPISLGNRILRAENAPLFFLSVLSFYFEL